MTRHRRAFPRRFALAVLFAGLGLLPGVSANAAPGVTRTPEYDLKAVFLFQFAHFVEWPAKAFSDVHSPITIGVLGDDPFGGGLDEIVANEVVGGRKLIVRRYRGLDQVDSCHILFICASETERMVTILGKLRGRSVLTVGDTDQFVTQNGIIGFKLSKNRLKLRINIAAADTAKLIISSKLLRQAEIVGAKGLQG
jgi:hypothetical protein